MPVESNGLKERRAERCPTCGRSNNPDRPLTTAEYQKARVIAVIASGLLAQPEIQSQWDAVETAAHIGAKILARVKGDG